MKVLQYVQVLLLLGGIAYLAAFHLDNRLGLSFPVPFGSSLTAPASVALLGGFLAGLAYASLIFIPPAIRRATVTRRLARRVRELEATLAGTRQAAPTPPAVVPVIPDREPANGETVLLPDGPQS